MAKKLVVVLCIFLMIPFISGCGDSLKFWKKNKETEVVHKKLPPFNVLFKRTVEMYNSKQYKDAINSFLFLRENYPQETAYQSRITLYLADSHFHQKEYPEAIANYQEFIKLYPTNPDVVYAYFQIGMCYYKQRRSYDRDASFVRDAIKNFKKVLDIAPPGVLVNESIRMITMCQRELARHDLFIADFYMRTHHYKSAIFRYENVLQTFPDLKIYDRVHLGIGKAYLKLHNMDAALRHLSFVARRYPNSPYGKEAWKLLQKDFKITSRDQLPVVIFPVGPKIPASSGHAVAKKKPAEKVPVQMAQKARTQSAPSKPSPAAEAKPHVYLPKITKIQQRPSVYSPPVNQVVSPAPQKTVPPAPSGTSSTPSTTAKAASTPPPVPSKKTKVAAAKPHPTEATTVSPKTPEPPKTASAPPKPKTEKKSPEPIPASKQKTPPKMVQAAKKPLSPPKKTVAVPNVKRMVKTDTLPPKKETSGSGLVGALDTRLPIHITSDHVEAQQARNSVRFYGKVVARQKHVTLKCDTLTAYYAKGGKAIDKIVAHGHVVITQLNKKVTCAKAIFYNAQRKIELEGTPVVAWDGPNRITGNKMILLLEKNEIQILGSKRKPTELLIYPNQKPELLKTPGKMK